MGLNDRGIAVQPVELTVPDGRLADVGDGERDLRVGHRLRRADERDIFDEEAPEAEEVDRDLLLARPGQEL